MNLIDFASNDPVALNGFAVKYGVASYGIRLLENDKRPLAFSFPHASAIEFIKVVQWALRHPDLKSGQLFQLDCFFIQKVLLNCNFFCIS